MHGQFVIPPGAADYRVESDLTFTRDVKLLNLLPHSHLRGVRWEYQAVLSGRPAGDDPVGARVRLQLADRLHLRRAAGPAPRVADPRFGLVRQFGLQPVDPDATAEVRWGEQTDEEMMYTALSFLIDERLGSGD